MFSPSANPRERAIPKLVVPIALNPAFSSAKADSWSQHCLKIINLLLSGAH
jgi:hypothetical protein